MAGVAAQSDGVTLRHTAASPGCGSSGVADVQDGSSADVLLNARPVEAHAVPAATVEADLPKNLYTPLMDLLAVAGAARQRGHISSYQQEAIFEAVLSTLKQMMAVDVRRVASNVAVTPAVPVVPSAS